MLAANPGRVKEVFPVPLPEDRTLRIRENTEFMALAARLRNSMEEGS
jgi:NitT/TauT family transport system ATP-binding protein